jgi:hypothetical protein
LKENHQSSSKLSIYGDTSSDMTILVHYSIVAIHSLDGDRELSWTAKTVNGHKMWLKDRDMLPKDISNARILTYGYDAATWGEQQQLAKQTMHGHAKTLVARVVQYRARTNTPKVCSRRLSCFILPFRSSLFYNLGSTYNIYST